ncbi:MAG: tetratricopeptide repeat protein, partial [Bacteroidales bacterium]|nr:tetratricopeptide repeat protein [Bacteroidales bacterium]
LFEKGSVAIKDLADEVAKYGDYAPSHIRKDVYEAIKNGDFEKLEELKKELSNVHTTAKTVAFNRDNIIDSLQAKLLICKAEFNYKEALTCIDDLILLDPNNIDFLFEAGNIAQEYIADYDKALEYYDKALNIALKFGEINEMVANLYNNIGCVYDKKGEYDKALTYHTKALDIQKQVLTENHPNIANSYGNIGVVYYNEGEYDNALTYYTKALDILKQVFPENGPDIASLYNNIGGVYDKKGEYDKALSYFTKALVIRKQVLPENHPNIAASYNNIGTVYSNKGEYDKALIYHTKALDIRKRVFPENHHGIAISYYSIGVIYYYKEEYEKALAYFEDSLKIYQLSEDNNTAEILKSIIEKCKQAINIRE